MEKKFYENDFEQFLKESADQFRMFPSKKVWRGIYNDTHPGRRWPSVAMSLVFIFTLVLVGHLNTQRNQHHHTYSSIPKKDIDLQNTDKNIIKPVFTNTQSLNATNQQNTSPHSTLLVAKQNQPKNHLNNNDKTGLEEKVTAVFADVNNTKDVDQAIGNNTLEISNVAAIYIENKNSAKDRLLTKNDNIAQLKTINTFIPDELNTNALNQASPSGKYSDIKNESLKNTLRAEDLHSVPNNKSLNKLTKVNRIKIHKNPRISWTYYVSPSISYRNYSKYGDDADQRYLGYLNNVINTGSNRAVIHRPSAGLEGGVAMKYAITKKLKFTSGFQLNYSSYSIQANNIHPIIATMVLHNENTGMPYAVSSISYFSNGPGTVPENLHNYNLQLSLPVGLEYQLAGNNRIQWQIAATLQPSVVLAKRSYILTTDKRNYISAASLYRPLNLSTNIGTFISFNSNKFKWQLGPQVNYQVLSSYKNQYQLREHLINYGIRLGVSKIIK